MYGGTVLSPGEIEALGDQIAEVAAHIDAAIHELLTRIRAFDRVGGWHAQGALSCAHWLSWRIGMGLGPAREKVRVAHRLADLPLIDDALRRGEVSYSKVRAMTRVATAENEAELLSMARNTTASQLDRICRLRRQIAPPGEPGSETDDRRYVASYATDDGMVMVHLRLHPEEAARVMAAIECCAGTGSLADGAVAAANAILSGQAHGVSAESEATVVTAQAADTAEAETTAGTEGAAEVGATSSTAASAEPSNRFRPPIEVLIHISAETLQGYTPIGDGISAATSRRLLCDAGIAPVLDDSSGRTIDIGRKSRIIPVALRRALVTRDVGCRWPGCTNRRFVEAHHLQHWIDGGETSLSNTALLCSVHHRHVHELGYSIAFEGEELVVRDPRGVVIPPSAARDRLSPDALARLRRDALRRGVRISAETNRSRWDGEPIDYESCVAALGRRPAPRASADAA